MLKVRVFQGKSKNYGVEILNAQELPCSVYELNKALKLGCTSQERFSFNFGDQDWLIQRIEPYSEVSEAINFAKNVTNKLIKLGANTKLEIADYILTSKKIKVDIKKVRRRIEDVLRKSNVDVIKMVAIILNVKMN